MKRVAFIVLSLSLVYGGVAWALATCLRHDDHPDHLSEEHYSHSHHSVSSDGSRDSAAPLIHCPFPQYQIGPAAHSGLTKLRRTSEVTSVRAPFFHNPGSVILGGSLWLAAVFRGNLTSPYPDNFGRHLFLSVLRI
jgi:hypothetical protein